jgi:hypothetical protein
MKGENPAARRLPNTVKRELTRKDAMNSRKL